VPEAGSGGEEGTEVEGEAEVNRSCLVNVIAGIDSLAIRVGWPLERVLYWLNGLLWKIYFRGNR